MNGEEMGRVGPGLLGPVPAGVERFVLRDPVRCEPARAVVVRLVNPHRLEHIAFFVFDFEFLHLLAFPFRVAVSD